MPLLYHNTQGPEWIRGNRPFPLITPSEKACLHPRGKPRGIRQRGYHKHLGALHVVGVRRAEFAPHFPLLGLRSGVQRDDRDHGERRRGRRHVFQKNTQRQHNQRAVQRVPDIAVCAFFHQHRRVLDHVPRPADAFQQIEPVYGQEQRTEEQNPRDDLRQRTRAREPMTDVEQHQREQGFKGEETEKPVVAAILDRDPPREPD